MFLLSFTCLILLKLIMFYYIFSLFVKRNYLLNLIIFRFLLRL